MKEDESFIYSFATPPVFEWIKRIDPDMFGEIKERVAEGRWELNEGFWVQPDCFSGCGESYARQALYGQQYLMKNFGPYIISGTATHTILDESYPVKKGNVILVNYNVPHSFTFDPLTEDFVTYDLLFTPDFFNISGMENNEFYSLASSYLFASIFTEFSSQNSLKTLIETKSKEFHSLFKKIYQEYINREKGFQNIIRAHLIELITKLFREIDKQQPDFTRTHEQLVEKAIRHMQENYKSHISLDEIVSGMFLSKNYFRQIFKKTTGTSITSYIQELRISEACRLLETTVESSAEIAGKCGFNDTKFFYQTFKKATGTTPAEYRKEKILKQS